jgi:hypothetical protein
MAGHKNQGLFRLTAAKAAGGACFIEIDKMIEEVMALGLPGEDADLDSGRNHETAAMAWRLPRAERPRCRAETRTRSSCRHQALPNGRCPITAGCPRDREQRPEERASPKRKESVGRPIEK